MALKLIAPLSQFCGEPLMLGNLTMRKGELDAPFITSVSQHLPQVLNLNTELFVDTMAYGRIIMHDREINVLLLMGVSQQPPQLLYLNT